MIDTPVHQTLRIRTDSRDIAILVNSICAFDYTHGAGQNSRLDIDLRGAEAYKFYGKQANYIFHQIIEQFNQIQSGSTRLTIDARTKIGNKVVVEDKVVDHYPATPDTLTESRSMSNE